MYIMEDWCKEKGIPLTDDQVISSLYCRAKGLRFMIDYGYENVIAKADEVFDRECDKVKK
jgi:hypothetical protein